MNEQMNALLTITEFAKAREVTPRTVNNWLAADRLAGARKLDGKWMIPAEAVVGPPRGGALDVTTSAPAVGVVAPSYAPPVFMPRRRPIPIAAVAAEFDVPVETVRRWARAGEGGLSLSSGPHGSHYVWIEGL